MVKKNWNNSVHALKVLRETYRIIKDTFHKEGNQIESLKYYRNEMIIYEKEINRTKSENYIEEKISLFLNKISNRFGTSWVQGLKFTIFVTVIFYILFLLVLQDELKFEFSWLAISQTIKHFIEFLNIAKWNIEPFDIKNYNWGYVFLFLGRIFIGYGYYQIIQAFRKYGK